VRRRVRPHLGLGRPLEGQTRSRLRPPALRQAPHRSRPSAQVARPALAERWVQAPDGASLFVNEIGPADRPPVIELHGGPAAHRDSMLPAFARLADTFRLVLYDQRGGGRSRAAGNVPLDFDTQVADVEAVILGSGLEAAHVVGYSFGGLIAMVFAARHPARVEKLALCSSAPPSLEYRAPLERALAAAQ